MTREEYLKSLILDKGYNLKSFAKEVGIKYTTLMSMLEKSIGGASVDNVIKICKGLGISVELLENAEMNLQTTSQKIVLSEHEQTLIHAYRKTKEMQHPVDVLLGVTKDKI